MTTTVDRSPQRIDWSFARGDTWTFDFLLCVPTTGAPTTGEPADLTGSTWLLQVRSDGPEGALFTTATVDATAQSVGTVVGTVDELVTRGAVAGKKTYYYDLEQTLSGSVATPVAGYITVVADASNPTRTT